MGYKIVVYAICKNEINYVQSWLDSMSEADYICVLDTGSTDGTYEALQAAGIIVKQKEIKPWRFDTARNESMFLIPSDADICVSVDLDEVFEPGWAETLRNIWKPEMGMLRYYYISTHTLTGAEGKVFFRDKIHINDPATYYWKYSIHEVLNRDPEAPLYCTKDIICHHFQNTATSRKNYLDLLEVEYKENPDARNLYNYARELYIYENYEQALEVFKEYQKITKNVNEQAHAYLLMGHCEFFMENNGSAQRYYKLSIETAPHFRMAYLELANLSLIKKDYVEALKLINQALSIRERHLLFVDDEAAWVEKPYILAMWALKELKLYKEALHYAQEAALRNPYYPKIKEIIAELQTLNGGN